MNDKLEVQTKLVDLLVQYDGSLPYGTRKRFAKEYNISANTLKQWLVDIRHGPRDGSRDWSIIIIKLLGGCCAMCGAPDRLHIHHITPLAEGGPHGFENLQILCKPCHRLQHAILRKRQYAAWLNSLLRNPQ